MIARLIRWITWLFSAPSKVNVSMECVWNVTDLSLKREEFVKVPFSEILPGAVFRMNGIWYVKETDLFVFGGGPRSKDWRVWFPKGQMVEVSKTALCAGPPVDVDE